jgi:nucleolar complex protein 3
VLKGINDSRGDFQKCREALETLFREDEDGTPSLDAVTLLAKMMKAREFKVDESVLNIFLHLRLLSEFSSKGSQSRIDAPEQQLYRGKKIRPKREFRTKKQRKLEKERKVVEAEMKDADATVSHEERDRMQAESLKLVFATYFRILKARSANLMGAVLEGLVRYAHLINQDFFGDLLEALRELILRTEDESSLGIDDQEVEDQEITRSASRESLLCVVTAFALLQGQDASKAASTLHLDLNFFITHLYRTLYPLAVNPDLELGSSSLRLPDPDSPASAPVSTSKNKVNMQTTTVLLLRCLTAVLVPPLAIRAIPPVRLAAFTKQLSTSSLQLPEKSCLAILGLLNTVTKTHGRKISALWNTEERKGDGVFDPLRAELESSNPFASTIWEGEILRKHFCPRVREAAEMMQKNVGAIK